MNKKTFFSALLVTISFWSISAMGEMAPPSPPGENPHPPVTAEDKKRVAFAEQAVEGLLKKDLPASLSRPQPGGTPPAFVDKNPACLQAPACYGKDAAFVGELFFFRETYGKATETRHAHVIPWSFQKFQGGRAAEEPPPPPNMETTAGAAKPMQGPLLKADEYMVHVYIRFDKSGAWHHVNVILTEDKAGNPSLRHFFIMPMQSEMPPGVVC